MKNCFAGLLLACALPQSALLSGQEKIALDKPTLAWTIPWDADWVKRGTGKNNAVPMAAAVFSKDSKLLSLGEAGERDGFAKVFLINVADGKKLHEKNGHQYAVTALAFHPDGLHLASTGRDTTVRVWRIADGKHVADIGKGRGGQFQDGVHAISFSTDGRWLAAADMAGKIQVWRFGPDSSTGRAGDDPRPLKIHIIAGGEYDPIPSMTDFKKLLEAQYRVECTTSFYPGTGSPSKLENLDSLKTADLMILFARRMALREDQMKLIRAHWEQGKPIVGIRTAQHAFQKADNEFIDRKLFGGAYGVGPSSNGGYKTAIAKGQENHPVLKGVGEIKAAKYAYGNGPLAESAVVLQIVGRIKDKDFPVTWVNTYKGGRYFYTALGSPNDFQQDNMKRLLTNAVFWTTQRDAEKMKR